MSDSTAAPAPAPLTLLIGRTREDRRRALARVAGLDQFQRPDFLYITATRRKADLVRAAFWDQPNKPPTFLPAVMPFGAWRDDLAARWGSGRAPLDPVARDLLAGQIFRGLRPRLRVWRGLDDGPLTRAALAEFAESWAMGFSGPERPPLGDEPFALRFPGEPEPAWGPLFASTQPVGPALREDAWRFLGAWRAALGRSPSWTDRPGHVRGLLAALVAGDPLLLATMARHRTLIVDDLLWLPPLDLAILRTFVQRWREAVPEGTVHLCLESPAGGDVARARRWLQALDGDDAGLRVTAELRRSWRGFLSTGRVVVADAHPAQEDLADLLAVDGRLPADPGGVVGRVRGRAYASERAELRAVARALKAELLAGRAADSLYVSFPDLDRYAPLVRDVFAGYGVPFVIEKGEPLLHSPPASAARQLLALAMDVDAASVRSLLASGWVRAWFPIDPERAARLCAALELQLGRWSAPVLAEVEARIAERVALRPTMTRLHRAIVEAGARGDQPTEWLAGCLPPRLRAADATLARYADDGSPAERVDRVHRGAVSDAAGLVLEGLAIDRLLAALAPLRGAATPSTVAESFLDVLESLGIRPSPEDPTLDPVRADAQAANNAAIDRLRELVAEVARSLRGVDLASPGTTTTRPLAVFRDALDDAVSRTNVHPRSPSVGVQVVGLRDLHGADVAWLWVAGLSNGAFPRPPTPTFLLPSLEPPLVPTLDRGAEDRAVFDSLLRSVGHGHRRAATLILSWPRSEGARELVPSPVIQDLLALRVADTDATLGTWWAARQVEDEAALPPLLARDELLTRPSLCAALPAEMPADAPGLLSAADHALLRRWDEVVDARTTDAGFGAWDGVLGMDRPWRRLAVEWLGDALSIERRPSGQPRLELPATGLEAWARCPIRFFFDRVLDVDEPRPFAAQPGADESGSLVHEVLERALRERIDGKRAGRLPSAALGRLGPEEIAAFSARLVAVADAVVQDRMGHRRGPWMDRLREDLTAGLTPDHAPWQGPLARFVAEETRGPFLDAEPAYVERSFKQVSPARAAQRLLPRKDRTIPFHHGTGDVEVLIRGTIDRVDLPPPRGRFEAQGDGGVRLVVYDYKTGRTPHIKDVDEGRQLQPALYPFAIDVPRYARGIVSGYWELREQPGRQRRRLAISRGLWWYLKKQRGLRRPIGFRRTTRATTMTAWRAWLMRADWYGQLVASGVFPPTLNRPEIAGCRSCPFRRACRTEPVRTERILNPPRPAEDRVAPVFWPHPVSVSDELEAMYGHRDDLDDPPEDPVEAPAASGSWTAEGTARKPAAAPDVAPDEFDDLFGEDLF